jgi:cytochrome P450
MGNSTLAYMDTCFQRYGDIFNTGIVNKPNQLVFVSHPQGIQELLTHDTQEFEAPGRVNGILKPLLGDKS